MSGLVVAHGQAISTSGRASLTLDTRGAAVIYIFAYANGNADGVPTDGLDSNSNIWTGIGNPFSSCAGSTGSWRVFNPTTSATHNFRAIGPSGSFPGFGTFTVQLIVLALAPSFYGESFLLRNQTSGKNPIQPGAITPTVNNFVMVSVAQAGCGLVSPTVDSGFTIIEAQPNQAVSYNIQAVPSGPINITWTGLVALPGFGSPTGASIIEGFGVFNSQPTPSSSNTRIYEA